MIARSPQRDSLLSKISSIGASIRKLDKEKNEHSKGTTQRKAISRRQRPYKERLLGTIEAADYVEELCEKFNPQSPRYDPKYSPQKLAKDIRQLRDAAVKALEGPEQRRNIDNYSLASNEQIKRYQ